MKKGAIVLLSFICFSSIFGQELQQDKNKRTTEIGIVFNNLNNFGLRYKYGNYNSMLRITSLFLSGSEMKNEYTDYSYNDLNSNELPKNTTSSLGFGLNIGIEKRLLITDNFCFIYGLDWINSYRQSKTVLASPSVINASYTDSTGKNVDLVDIVNSINNSDSYTINTGFGFVIGVQLQINNYLSVRAELIPYIQYSYSKVIGLNSYKSYKYNGYQISPSILNRETSQTTISKGFSYGLTNSGASITIAYRF